MFGQPGTSPKSGVDGRPHRVRPPGRGGRRGRSRAVVVRSGAGERPPRTRCAPRPGRRSRPATPHTGPRTRACRSWRRRRAAQSSAYSAGSWSSRCTTHASRPVPSSHDVQTSRQVCPSRVSQLPMNRRDAAGFEMVAHRADQLSDDGVADQAGVAVLVGHDTGASRRDDERRVAHDEVEPFARDRVEQVPGPQVDRHLGERRGEAGEGEGALGEVGGDDRAARARRGAGPAPRSRCRGREPALRGRRGVHWATVIEAGPTPRTWSGGRGPPRAISDWSETTHQSWASSP